MAGLTGSDQVPVPDINSLFNGCNMLLQLVLCHTSRLLKALVNKPLLAK